MGIAHRELQCHRAPEAVRNDRCLVNAQVIHECQQIVGLLAGAVAGWGRCAIAVASEVVQRETKSVAQHGGEAGKPERTIGG